MRQHLLGIEYLKKSELENYLSNAEAFVEVSQRELKKVPALRGKTVINLFLEPSTRTRASFEIAAKRLSADTVNMTGSESSVTKGETLIDTARTLQAMAPDVIVVRHKESGVPNLLVNHISRASIINAGDGLHEHPTQALLDCLTLKQHFAAQDRPLEGLKVAIVGDIRHSRVARSNIWAHKLLGNEVRLIAPPTLMPPYAGGAGAFEGGVQIFHSLAEGLEGADVVMVLRMQLERQSEHFVPTIEEYIAEYGINEHILRRYAPGAVVLHPGPINRGVELSSEVADGPRALIGNQVTNGVAVRMAVLFALATGESAISEQESA
ncbi:MAG: aspartate carbamoyltransferase catalytic subunit [Deltaproteobacteria bacterium]|nr:aspartate carbamoyltransferase catalytic subunit [Deltaproteobacteria bacterium]